MTDILPLPFQAQKPFGTVTMNPTSLQAILSCCLLFVGYCYAESIAPITSVSVPPLPTSKSEKDYINFIEGLTYNLMDKSYSVEPSAIAILPPPESRHYCSHLSDCPELSGNAPSDVGTIIGPDYIPGYNLQQLIDDAKAITKEVAITTHHTTTSQPTVVTVTRTSSHTPFTSTMSDWHVVVCDRSTVIRQISIGMEYHATSCLPPSTTITSSKPVVTIHNGATPCNWGTMSSTDIYTSVSSVLMDACGASAVPTEVVMVPEDDILTKQPPWSPKSWTTTMSACNPKTMTIKGIDGPTDEVRGHYLKESGEVLVTADKNYFDPANLQYLVDVSAHFIARAASSNGQNISFRTQGGGIAAEVEYGNITMYSSNSSELKWYDPGFTQYTQAFIVHYAWKETIPNIFGICEKVEHVGNEISEEIPELAPAVDLVAFFCYAGAAFSK